MTEQTMQKSAPGGNWQPTTATFFALVTVLVAYPAIRVAIPYLNLFPAAGGREWWWGLWSSIFVGHWICVAICAAAISSEKGRWASIGFDWKLFIRGRYVFILIVILAVAVAYYAPTYFYDDTLPERMRSHPLGPVSSAERMFWIAMAVTAGVAEEIMYRGYAITRLRRIVGLPIAVAIPAISFALMHGPSAFIPQFLGLYIFSALLFTAAFLFLGSRRLEWIILLHITVDLALIAAP